jgi:pimeloyl-ACP methyl ester carboxylesterase
MLTPNGGRWGTRRCSTGRASRGPGVPAGELPGIGHYLQLERPDPIAAALDDALAEVA